jgi:hypothetical protein
MSVVGGCVGGCIILSHREITGLRYGRFKIYEPIIITHSPRKAKRLSSIGTASILFSDL